MRRKEIDQKLKDLLDGAVKGDQAEQLRKRVNIPRASSDEFELYRQLELEFQRLSDSDSQSGKPATGSGEPSKDNAAADADIDWDTTRDALRTAMERDALLSEIKPRSSGRIFKAAALVVVLAVAAMLAPKAMDLLVSATPLPIASSISVQWTQPADSADKKAPAAAPENSANQNSASETYPAIQLSYESAAASKTTGQLDFEWQKPQSTAGADSLDIGRRISAGTIVVISPKAPPMTAGESLY